MASVVMDAALRPLPAEGPWAFRRRPAVAVIGAAGTADRLDRYAAVRSLEPRSDVTDALDVDVVVVELSAFEDPSGPWSGALRPVGDHRGAVLAALLARCRSASVPVIGLDDRAAGAGTAWDDVLGEALDDVALLGAPIGVGNRWNPGCRWSLGALHRAVDVAGGVGDLIEGDLDRSLADVPVVVDDRDPWARHAAAELAALGVPVVDPDGDDLDPGPLTGEWAALCALLRRVDAPEPEPVRWALVDPPEAPGWVVGPSDLVGAAVPALTDDPHAAACVVTLVPGVDVGSDDVARVVSIVDRTPDVTVVRSGGLVAVATDGRTDVSRRVGDPAWHDRVRAAAVDVSGLTT